MIADIRRFRESQTNMEANIRRLQGRQSWNNGRFEDLENSLAIQRGCLNEHLPPVQVDLTNEEIEEASEEIAVRVPESPVGAVDAPTHDEVSGGSIWVVFPIS